MTEPTTQTGKRLVARLRERCDNLGGCESHGADHVDVSHALPAIEAEARDQQRERLRVIYAREGADAVVNAIYAAESDS